MVNKNLWDLSNKPATQTKLNIIQQVFSMWVTIWNKQAWTDDELFIIDLFAGKGKYNDGTYGSPLIFLDTINSKTESLRKGIRFNIFFVDKTKNIFNELKLNVDNFLNDNKNIKNILNLNFYNEDANSALIKIIKQIKDSNKNPLFVLIDPSGLQIKKDTLQHLVSLNNPKDILFNYILEGVRRTKGVARKALSGNVLNYKEIKTVQTFKEFIGYDINFIGKSDVDLMESYCQIFTSSNLKVIAYDLPYPNRNDILYYLLFASRKQTITDIVKNIYARNMEKQKGGTLFGGKEFYENNLLTFSDSIKKIERKSLLYKTKVEYGDWTINHIVGCKHGCNFPCYAMMMARKFGWIKDYQDWRNPKIVENALYLLEHEIPRYKDKIDFVHLSFMTDPFMYDSEKRQIISEIKELTLKIIERLNAEGIRVTTLTKGLYPSELLDDRRFLRTNEYGITLVSLNENFKEKYEPYSSPYEKRIESLKRLAEAGLKTWLSIEPYPTPELDPDSIYIEKILERLFFVKKIIFGKLNYNRLISCNGKPPHHWRNSSDFYKSIARKVINFCQKNNIQYHIKSGTPLSNSNATDIFK